MAKTKTSKKKTSSKRTRGALSAKPLTATPKLVMTMAQELAPDLRSEDDVVARLALLHPNVALASMRMKRSSTAASFSIPFASNVFEKAKQAFATLQKVAKKIVCTDLKYCKNRDGVGDWFKAHLPKITALILKGTPTGTIAKVLGLLGVTGTSWAAIAAIVVAWLLKVGLDSVCACPES